jgi:hypothetical protein
VRPDAYNSTLVLGDIVRVRLRRETEPGVVSHHDYLYEVERINKSLSGAVELDLMHYPIDANGRSIVALYVAGTTINGFEYPTGRGTFTCDVNDPDDEDPIPDEGGDLPNLPPDLPDDIDPDPDGTEWPPNIPEPSFPAGGSGTDGGNDSAPSGGINNPADPIDSVDDENVGGGGTIGYPPGLTANDPILPGDTITFTPPCTGANIGAHWYNVITGTKIYLDSGDIVYDPTVNLAASIAINEQLGIGPDEAWELRVTYCCPDPGITDGFSECQAQTAGTYGSDGLRLLDGIGTYTATWTYTRYDLSSDSSCPTPTGGATIECEDPFTPAECFTGNPLPQRRYYTLTKTSNSLGQSNVYGLRAAAITRTVIYPCGAPNSTVTPLPLLSIKYLNGDGEWIDLSSSLPFPFGYGNEGVNAQDLGSFSRSDEVTKAIAINVQKL